MTSYKKKAKLSITIEFLGATEGVVSGSGILVTITQGIVVHKFLIDYGMYQGEFEFLNEDRAISAEGIDAIFITHAHIDHCGAIPALLREKMGSKTFKGKIYASRETLEQATYLLYDTAKINESSIKWIKNSVEKTRASLTKEREKAEREDAKPKEIAAYDSAMSSIDEVESNVFYTIGDVDETIKHFCPIEFNSTDKQNVTIDLFEGIRAKFIPTTHINGSTMIELTASYEDESKTIVFTGDIGQTKTVLYRQMDIPMNNYPATIVLESLHGTIRSKETLNESILIMKKTIKRAIKKQKTIIIPAFAMDRYASIIKVSNDFLDQGMNVQCFIDSPLAEKELYSYINSYKTYDSAWFNYEQGYPFKLERFKIIQSYQDHILATKYRGPNIFLTSSCTGNGGRVIDYFTQHIENENAVFIFPGYLPDGCVSRILCDTKYGQVVKIHGHNYTKRCETLQVHGFSSHGYLGEKVKVLLSYPKANEIFLNHGDDESLEQVEHFLSKFSKADIIMPLRHYVYDIV